MRRVRYARRLGALGAAAVVTVVLAQNTTSASFTAVTADNGNQVTAAAAFCTSSGNSVVTAVADAAVYQSNPTTTYGTGVSMGVGSATTANAYSYVKFTLPTVPAHCVVTGATLKIHASTPTSGATLAVYRADTAWTESITWNTVGRPGFTGTPATTASLASAGFQSWNVTTLTQQLYAGPDYGFACKDSVDNAASARYQTWDSREATTVANRPTLTVTWG
jgi:hypothetical protein